MTRILLRSGCRVICLVLISLLLICLFLQGWRDARSDKNAKADRVVKKSSSDDSTNLAVNLARRIAENNSGRNHAVLHVHIQKCGGTSYSFGLKEIGKIWRHGSHAMFEDVGTRLLMSDFEDIYGGAHALSRHANRWLQAYKGDVSTNSTRMIQIRGGTKQIPKPIGVSCHVNPLLPTRQWPHVLEMMKEMWQGVRNVLLVTILREPDSRVLSHWGHFDRKNLTHPHQLPLKVWETYVNKTGSFYVQNFGKHDWVPWRANQSRADYIAANRLAVESAVEELQSFDIIGRTACVAQFVALTEILIDDEDVHGARRTVRKTGKLPMANAKVNTAKKPRWKSEPLREEYAALLRSPLEGGLVLDHLIWDRLFQGNGTECEIGTDAHSGILVHQNTIDVLRGSAADDEMSQSAVQSVRS